MRQLPAFASSLLLAAALFGCKRQRDEVPCTAVGARLLVIAQAETQSAKVDEQMRQRVALQLPALRDALDDSCERNGWSLEVRRCMVAAADSAALSACQSQLTDEQRAALARASAKPQ